MPSPSLLFINRIRLFDSPSRHPPAVQEESDNSAADNEDDTEDENHAGVRVGPVLLALRELVYMIHGYGGHLGGGVAVSVLVKFSVSDSNLYRFCADSTYMEWREGLLDAAVYSRYSRAA